ncbi:MAG: ABC transporter ATP-binding protein [Bdellovibrionota bacterium]|nr:MAG: ABC transporter ATP-binding protein [Bdellovibrionota bacterium]
MSEVLLSVQQLTCGYPSRPILSDVTFEIRSGEWIALLGRNGAGKSTLLRTLMGLQPFTGSITVAGDAIGTLSATKLSHRIAYLPQHTAAPSTASVRQLLLFSRYARQRSTWIFDHHDTHIAERTIDLLNLGAIADQELNTLSGGELQRAMIGSCLVQEPQLLLLDEPTSAFDPVTKADVWSILHTLKEATDLTMLVATHDLTTALRSASRIMALADGSIVFDGSAAAILESAPWRRVYGRNLRTGRDDLDGSPIVYGVE